MLPLGELHHEEELCITDQKDHIQRSDPVWTRERGIGAWEVRITLKKLSCYRKGVSRAPRVTTKASDPTGKCRAWKKLVFLQRIRDSIW